MKGEMLGLAKQNHTHARGLEEDTGRSLKPPPPGLSTATAESFFKPGNYHIVQESMNFPGENFPTRKLHLSCTRAWIDRTLSNEARQGSARWHAPLWLGLQRLGCKHGAHLSKRGRSLGCICCHPIRRARRRDGKRWLRGRKNGNGRELWSAVVIALNEKSLGPCTFRS